MKKTVFLLLTFCLLFSFCVTAVGAENKSLSWYCTRQKAHKQAIAAPELRFAEELGAYYIDHAHGDDCADRVVYLTFDAGYVNENVTQILDTLRAQEVPAAFFVLKHPVEKDMTLIKRMADEGHFICNHTATHPDLSAASEEQIRQELEGLEEACRRAGIEIKPYFRPPEGKFSSEMLRVVRNMGYKTVFWSFAYADWDNRKQPSAEKALRCIMDNIHNGAVLLLHPTSATNAKVLPTVIAELKAQGYRFGRLDELCGD